MHNASYNEMERIVKEMFSETKDLVFLDVGSFDVKYVLINH